MLFWKQKIEFETGWTNAKNNGKKNNLKKYKTKQQTQPNNSQAHLTKKGEPFQTVLLSLPQLTSAVMNMPKRDSNEEVA